MLFAAADNQIKVLFPVKAWLSGYIVPCFSWLAVRQSFDHLGISAWPILAIGSLLKNQELLNR